MARRRTRYLLLAVAMMLAGGAIPAIAVGVEDPTNAFSDEFDGTTDLGLYLLDRFNPGLGYTPTLTEGTYDGRAVGIFHIDSTGPVAGDPNSFYRFQGFQRAADGTTTGYYDNGFGTCLETTFHLNDDFATNDRFASFRATTNNATTSGRKWPIAGVRGYADATPDEL